MAHTRPEHSLDDTIDDASTILDGHGGRPSFEQETVVSDYAGESVRGAITEFASRLDLGNLNLVSWKAGARKVYLGNTGHEEIQDDAAAPRLKFHAISDLVCHPSKTPAPLRGSRKPLPPTTSGPPPIPKPPPDGFYQPYLDSITKPGPLEEQSGIESLWHAWDQARRGIKPEPSSRSSETHPVVEPEKLDDLSVVSPMFFDPEFDLAKPLVWQSVLGSDSSTDSAEPASHAQEDLSHQLDVLESHLVSEISQRTPSFFSALSNLQSLTDQTSSCLDRLNLLRKQLAQLDQSTAIKGLMIVDKQEDLHVARMTERAMSQVEGVVATLEIVKQVANEGDWVGAQEGLEDVGRWWLKASPGKKRAQGNGAGEAGSNGDTNVQSGKHVLPQVKEEDEEDVVASGGVATPDNSARSPIPAQPFIPLATLPAIQYFPDEMSRIAATIQDQLELSFASICAAILDNTPPIERVDGDGLDRQSEAAKRPGTVPPEWRIRSDEEKRLRSSFEAQIGGLFHAFWRTDLPSPSASPLEKDQTPSPRPHINSITRIENVWRVAVLKSIKEGMRQLLQLGSEGEVEATETAGDATATGIAKGQSLVDTLKDMSHERFVSISEKVYETMMARIELVRVLGEVLEAQLEKTKPAEPTIISQVMGVDSAPTTSTTNPTGFIEAILHSAVDLANARASKILLTRTEIHAELDLGKFVSVYNSAWHFILWSEALVGRVVGSLRGVVVAQARAFLVKYHSARLQESAKLVEEEQWTQVEVPAHAQQVVDLLVRSAMSDPVEYFVRQSSTTGEGDESTDQAPVVAPETTEKTLKIEDQAFNTVSATLRSVVLLQDYAKVVVSLDVIVSDVMNRIVEYLKSFNSRTCQVVLGAGAMRSAGLKNITAKHLALASQSLSIIISLTPYIREFVRRHLNPKQAVVLIEFDKLKRDYQEHQYEIHAKLISIMADRLAVHCSTLRGIDWEAKPSAATNSYMEQLVKEITTLHKVLNKYLAPTTVHSIMGRVLDATDEKLAEEYSKVEFKSEDAKKRMMQDVSYIVERTKNLTDPTLPSPIAPLEELVKAKPSPRRAAHMSNALNGLLRRKNDTAGSSTTSPHDTATPTQSEKDVSEIEDEEDALAASDAPADVREQPELPTEDGSSPHLETNNPAPTEITNPIADQETNDIGAASSDRDANEVAAAAEQDVNSHQEPQQQTEQAQQERSE